MQFQLVGLHLLPFFLSTRILSIIQKHMLVSACSHCQISHFTCASSEGKRSSPTKKAQSYLHLTTLPTLDENTELEKNTRVCWLWHASLQTRVLQWALFTFSDCFSTWASSPRELLTCAGSPWSHVCPMPRQSSVFPAVAQENRGPLLEGTWRVAHTKGHRDLLTLSAELRTGLSTAPSQPL